MHFIRYIGAFVLSQPTRLTDRRTDGQLPRGYTPPAEMLGRN